MSSSSYSQLDRLLWVMDCLRDPDSGCPWDLKQDFASIVPHTIEEAYEVADAIERQDKADIQEELGDLLFQVVFYARLGKEKQWFDFEAIAGAMAEKLIRRHPHVFGEHSFSEQEVKQNWELEKARERQAKANDEAVSALDNIPLALPSLTRAYKLQKRCANVGFDWPDTTGVLDKIHEEIEEVQQELARSKRNEEALEEELGDLLFATVNLVRHLKKDPETALRRANAKFERRFRQVEQHADEKADGVTGLSLTELEHLWQSVKAAEK
ncbi:ATP diphosphatase [Saliniradius amylolyticus]|uniref:Nucleoside triphosphate pyrophosphohydrolase n=1 Tax=Saliniradius amylolyticus TaxID=2183582 RepID=A0A2S2E091_9ALTE|nr:nucleoside triphosphate pyrophosphohydrolase [Saliniradius amylolyticus]AWL11019.1 ATP diphosphatase [Saliniradius amylolyticus]